MYAFVQSVFYSSRSPFLALFLAFFALGAPYNANGIVSPSVLGTGIGYPNLLLANISAPSNFLTVNGFPYGATAVNPYGTIVSLPAPITCTAENLYFNAPFTPTAMQGTGGTLAVTSYRATAAAGGASMSATSLTCTIATGAYSCADTTDTVALTAGDFLELRGRVQQRWASFRQHRYECRVAMPVDSVSADRGQKDET